MLSGLAMLTRMYQFAFIGLLCAVAHLAHDKPLSRVKTDNGTGGPFTSVM